MTKPSNLSRQSFLFKQEMSDLAMDQRTTAEKEKAILGDLDPKKMIDAYEEQVGIREPVVKKARTVFTHAMISPGTNQLDDELLSELLNNTERYRVIRQSEFWTRNGEYKMFVIYEDNLDVKELQEKKTVEKDEE